MSEREYELDISDKDAESSFTLYLAVSGDYRNKSRLGKIISQRIRINPDGTLVHVMNKKFD